MRRKSPPSIQVAPQGMKATCTPNKGAATSVKVSTAQIVHVSSRLIKSIRLETIDIQEAFD
ncbi:MAG: hypothetical protein HQ525_05170 [Anaerolineae bacterium]|nr:hypothetical protein [Anaerolineae bacterium]